MDILVNIAGVKGEQDWETVYDVNLVNPPFLQWISTFLRKAFTWALRLPGLGCPERKVAKGAELYPSHPPVASPVRFGQSKPQMFIYEETGCLSTIFRHLKIEVLRRATCMQLRPTQLLNMLSQLSRALWG